MKSFKFGIVGARLKILSVKLQNIDRYAYTSGFLEDVYVAYKVIKFFIKIKKEIPEGKTSAEVAEIIRNNILIREAEMKRILASLRANKPGIPIISEIIGNNKSKKHTRLGQEVLVLEQMLRIFKDRLNQTPEENFKRCRLYLDNNLICYINKVDK